MIVIVTGGREFSGKDRLWLALDLLRSQVPKGFALCVVNGGARGADRLSSQWAEDRRETPGPRVYLKRFPADWGKESHCQGHDHPSWGAGPCRNQRMLDWVVAQTAGDKMVLACPGGKGTADCVDKALAAGLTVKTLDEILENTP